MSEGGRRSPRLDRVGPAADVRRDPAGKLALYTTAPGAGPPPVVIVACPHCGAERGLSRGEAVRLLLPVPVIRPSTRRILARCPRCGRCQWLGLRPGPGLQALLAPLP